MGLLVDVDQLLCVHVRVALGRAQTGVAEQFLDRTQVGAIGQEVRRE